MNKISLILIFLTAPLIRGATPLTDFLLNALANNENQALAESIATNIDNLDTVLLNNFMIKESIEDLYGKKDGLALFKQAVAAKKAVKSSGASTEQIAKMLKEANVQVPEIKDRKQAREQLVTFFAPAEVGGKLLAEIGATPKQIGDVQGALGAINVKA